MLSIFSISGIQASAESYETPASVEALGGEMSMEVSHGGLNFGEITPSQDKKQYFPEVNQREHMKNINLPIEVFHNEWMMNPYDPYIQPAYPSEWPPETYMDARAYNVRIVDNTLGNSVWKLLVRRIPFVHVGTGKQLENEHLFVGQMKDNAEVNGVDISDPNSNWNDPNGYELYSATTIGFDNIGVANYKGTAAKGEHLISMLSPDNEEGKNLKQPNLPIDQDYIYTEKNITLGLDKHSVIPEAANIKRPWFGPCRLLRLFNNK